MPNARPYHFHVLDVFTERRYTGNPLAVVLNADEMDTAAMQAVAREFNLSETIFTLAPDDPSHEAKVRIFTPVYEMPFAGHPTVGAAIHLAERRWPKGALDQTIMLEENAGLVPVRVQRREGRMRATFTAPVLPYPIDGAPSREDTAAALGLEPDEIRTDHPVALHQGGPNFLYVPLSSLEALARAKPCEPQWSKAVARGGRDAAYCYVPDPEANGLAFRARMFAPGGGTYEDPATGSASAILASQLLATGELSEGTTAIALRQGVEMGRPSEIGLEVDVADGALTAVRVTGSAVRVSDGQIFA